jgi:O-antigen ligase
MPAASIPSIRLSEVRPTFDKCLSIPILVYAYSLIVSPMLNFVFPVKNITESQLENQIFWPLVTAIALGCLALRNRAHFAWPPHFLWFAAYLALAGASTLWALRPEISFTRLATQTMMLISIVLPAMLAARTSDLTHGVFFCFAFGSILNAALILGGYSPLLFGGVGDEGYPGYFTDKNALGQFAALALLLALYEVFRPGGRRALGLIVVVISVYLVFAAHSKAALGCVVLSAILASLVLFLSTKMRVSLLIVLLPVPICYVIVSQLVGNLVNRISWYTFHNYDLSARTVIWDFVNLEIAKRPLLGWGYRSFWLVGSDSPSLVDTGGWVRMMPEAHNGYLDTILDTGHIGLVLFLAFIISTLYTLQHVVNRDPVRGWLLLSIALFAVLGNFIESGWMRGGDPLWLMFVLVAVESGRYWQPFHRGVGGAGPVLRTPVIAGRRPALARAGGMRRLPLRRDICT